MRRLAWALSAASLAMLLGGWGLTVAGRGTTPVADGVLGLALATFAVVGGLIASRLPGNAIGWLFCAAGALFGAASLAEGYADYAYAWGRPGGVWAAWLGSWLFLAPLFGTPPLLFLLFPDGRPLGPRWRAAVWLTASAIAVEAIGAALLPGPLIDAPVDGLANPVGVAGAEVVEGLGWGLGMLSILLGTASLTLRFRRSSAVERLQLKWFVSAAVLFALTCVACVAIWTAEGGLPPTGEAMVLTAYASIPVAAAIAILRHRLYDIDLVIRRTLVYGGLTAGLGATYLSLVLLLGLAMGESDIAVAASTLAVAALFGPARARLQALVDRRFFRRRYDAARTLEEFGGRLRDEIDLEAVGGELRGVVQETVAPAHVSLWLRSPR